MAKSYNKPLNLILISALLFSLIAISTVPVLGSPAFESNSDYGSTLSFSIGGSVESDDLAGSIGGNSPSDSSVTDESASETPTESSSDDTPALESPTESPSDGTPVSETPTELSDDTPVSETPTELSDGTPVSESPTESPSDDTPVSESPTESPSDDTPVSESPTEPSDDTPASETPTESSTQDTPKASPLDKTSSESETTYSIKYEANGGKGTMTPSEFKSGDKVIVKNNTFTRENYKFKEWNTAANGLGTSFSEGATLYPNTGYTLYAQWVSSGSYKVTYDANGGSGKVVDPKSPYESGSEVTVLSNSFTFSGKAFAGWNTKADGKGTSYKPGAKFIPKDDTVLYAQWSDASIYDLSNSTSTDKKLTYSPGQSMSITAVTTEDATFTWSLYSTDNKLIKTFPKNKNDTNRKSTFTESYDKEGDYILVLKAETKSKVVRELKWDISISTHGVSTSGDRIWREGVSSDKFVWDYLSFSGFYYDIDTGDGTERLTLSHPGLGSKDRRVKEGELKYYTESIPIDFEKSAWGSYEVIGFMADRYFAGYNKNTNFDYDGENILSDGFILKVLKDDTERHNLKVGQSLDLGDGIKLVANDINVNGDSVQLAITKNGKEEDSFIAKSKDTGVFSQNIKGTDVSTLVIYVDSIFQGSESSTVTIRGIFQLSSTPIEISDDFKSGQMSVIDYGKTDSGKYFIEMENNKNITLSADSTVKLMDNIEIIVADDSKNLRFALKVSDDKKDIDLRGTVYDADSSKPVTKWTPYNFEGLAYDINDDFESTESLYLKDWSNSRNIQKGSLVYEAKSVNVEFDRSSWGDYQVINFMGDKYFAGYTNNSVINDKKAVSLLSDGNLSKVLIDTNKKYDLKTGQMLGFEEGYAVKIQDIDVNGNSVQLELLKNNKSIDTEVVGSNSTVVFEKDIGDVDDVPYIALYVDSIFQGSESNTVTVRGIFQISDNILKIEDGQSFGKMEVDYSDSSSIVLTNKDRLTLSQGNSVDFMKVGNTTLSFKVGDSSTLRFYPYTSGGKLSSPSTDTSKNLSLSVQSSILLGQSATISVRAGSDYIEGVSVYENKSLLGKTNKDGTLTYKPAKVGVFNISVEKDGYNSTSRNVTVKEDIGNLSINVSPSDSIFAGTETTIRVVDAKDNSPLSGVYVKVEQETLQTDANGEVKYTFNNAGTVQIEASKAKFNKETASVIVKERAAAFEFDNFEISPESPVSYGSLKVKFNVKNVGVESGKTTIRAIISSEDGEIFNKTKNVSLKPGEETSIEFKFTPKKEGTYVVSLAEGEKSVSVPSGFGSVSVEKGSSAIHYLKIFIIILIVIFGLLIVLTGGAFAYGLSKRGANSENYKQVSSEMINDIKRKLNSMFKK